MTPCAFLIDPVHPIPPVDCCLSFFLSFLTQEKGGGSFWQPGAATAQKFGSQPQGVTSMTPGSNPAALTRCRQQVDCCLLSFFCFPSPQRGGRRSKAARRAATPKKSETAVLFVSAPNGDAWRSLPMATAYR